MCWVLTWGRDEAQKEELSPTSYAIKNVKSSHGHTLSASKSSSRTQPIYSACGWGYTSLYIKLEPSSSNYELCQQNSKSYDEYRDGDHLRTLTHLSLTSYQLHDYARFGFLTSLSLWAAKVCAINSRKSRRLMTYIFLLFRLRIATRYLKCWKTLYLYCWKNKPY
jgi:hypothetical protein